MQSQQRYYKAAGFIVFLIGLRIFTLQKVMDGTIKPSWGWWGFFGGIALMGLGWGIYDMARDKK